MSLINDLEIDEDLAAECQRWLRELQDDVRHAPYGVTVAEVLRAHFMLAEYFRALGEGIGGVGPKSMHLLQSAVSRQYVSLGGQLKWRDHFEAAATLFYGLVKNHAFHDANKRTALLTAIYQLQCNGRVVSVAQKEFEDLAVRVAEDELPRYPAFRSCRDHADPEVMFIARFFRRNTREVDRREFHMTYRQLGVILGRYGYAFGAPRDNRIDIVQSVEERHGLLGLRRRVVERRVTTIGFRNWGTEVSQKDIREVRRATRLTHENGYDTAVLTRGIDPLESLIALYSGPLRRLARK